MASSLCQISRVTTSHTGLLTFCIILCICKVESALFTVVGPDQPITAIVGEEIVLPCHLSPSMSAKNMQVRWFRSEFTNYVHLYRDGRDQFGQQLPEYERRTAFWKDGITDGNVSLTILNMRPSDEGQYKCLVEDGITYEEAVIELKVAGLGSNPIISVEDYQNGGILVMCQSAGWYPEPQVLWRNSQRHHIPSLSEIKSQKENGLFETKISAVIKEQSNQNLSCCIRNSLLDREKESAIHISAFFFPSVNPWMVALSVILVVLFSFLILTIYLFRVKEKKNAEIENKNAEIVKQKSEIENKNAEIVKQKSEIENKNAEIVKQKSEIENKNVEIGDLQQELEWRRAVACREDVTLDPDTAHPYLVLSEDGKSVRWTHTWQDLPGNPKRFDTQSCVLGREGFTSGRHWWEVEVGEQGWWAVGVARDSVKRKGEISFSPEEGVWAMQRWGGHYDALTAPDRTPLSLHWVPSRVRVCLDCTLGRVSFLDADTEAPIFTFPPASFAGGRIRPWLWVWDGEINLRHCQ
ncbi:butyrophilin subfamily 1 member A1 [Alligator mississippiensis]|uniref:butyrophilin subfamily 1 member A1 n=1 Tax=Alligator mississippiensis TaxID=8496 RepID=UPI0028780EA1|nr:butyrophilin subfamily 1 member A1 [Alligator mississippiensis]